MDVMYVLFIVMDYRYRDRDWNWHFDVMMMVFDLEHYRLQNFLKEKIKTYQMMVVVVFCMFLVIIVTKFE